LAAMGKELADATFVISSTVVVTFAIDSLATLGVDLKLITSADSVSMLEAKALLEAGTGFLRDLLRAALSGDEQHAIDVVAAAGGGGWGGGTGGGAGCGTGGAHGCWPGGPAWTGGTGGTATAAASARSAAKITWSGGPGARSVREGVGNARDRAVPDSPSFAV